MLAGLLLNQPVGLRPRLALRSLRLDDEPELERQEFAELVVEARAELQRAAPVAKVEFERAVTRLETGGLVRAVDRLAALLDLLRRADEAQEEEALMALLLAM